MPAAAAAINLVVAEGNHTSAQLMDGNSTDEGNSDAADPRKGADFGPLDPPDAELLRRSAQGDGSAFRELMDRHADAMFRLAASLVGNPTDAEDVLQEALTGAFRGAGKFQGRSAVKTWLTRIVLTQAALFHRDRKRRRLRQDDTAQDRLVASESTAGVEAKIDLHAALQRLSREHREVLVLRELEMLPYEQIAAVLELPVGTVESRLFRARAELRLVLRDYGS
jgi:RNA polymerase sigma-70 factor (ECF subfamily)